MQYIPCSIQIYSIYLAVYNKRVDWNKVKKENLFCFNKLIIDQISEFLLDLNLPLRTT